MLIKAEAHHAGDVIKCRLWFVGSDGIPWQPNNKPLLFTPQQWEKFKARIKDGKIKFIENDELWDIELKERKHDAATATAE